MHALTGVRVVQVRDQGSLADRIAPIELTNDCYP
jgi:hypothetical protein